MDDHTQHDEDNDFNLSKLNISYACFNQIPSSPNHNKIQGHLIWLSTASINEWYNRLKASLSTRIII